MFLSSFRYGGSSLVGARRRREEDRGPQDWPLYYFVCLAVHVAGG